MQYANGAFGQFHVFGVETEGLVDSPAGAVERDDQCSVAQTGRGMPATCPHEGTLRDQRRANGRGLPEEWVLRPSVAHVLPNGGSRFIVA